LATAAVTDENLMPLFITCVENDVTLGEICQTLRDVWGEYRPNVAL
jgi:methylmalonyl-CoA mutase N-terminal domain/subunit